MVALALPVVLSELGWMAQGVVDTIMVGRLGPVAIGAVAMGNAVYYAPSLFGIGILLGLDTLVAQAYGRNDEKLGSIERLMLDKMTGTVAYAVVKSGGLLAAVHHYPLAWDKLRYNPQRRSYDTDLTLDELRSGPCELDDTFDWGDRSLAETRPHYWGL